MKSMTGFGRGEAQREGVTWSVECSSVNRKQLEVAVNLPRELAELENAVRTDVSATVSRGRVNIAVRKEAAAMAADTIRVDHVLAANYFHAMHALALKLDIPSEVALVDITRLPGVMNMAQTEIAAEEAWPVIKEALAAALKQLNIMRAAEGASLRADIESRLAAIESLLVSIREKAATVPEHQRKALRQRLEEAGLPLPLDDERLVKEIALFADRTDISEELTRAASHIKQFRTYLDGDTPAGRSLDFLLQEFFREFNTMGSKCNNAEIAHHVVTAKTELEKIREQVQNAE
ncbi:YicC/YloC family endoribonuclease [Prosthecobacter sp.]|uniref:YicC/YloC family endoribonuclease n=1 Tax=Prosthecobacter sp. TaxID=1965333 RepID=UPI002ABCEB0D|nr:YicC/YloC family endoribonuclease [Prosthecobacter sp.]MDZ4404277.1 YicC/YloC family endoribonuclease [Prosthecobacter sp.]